MSHTSAKRSPKRAFANLSLASVAALLVFSPVAYSQNDDAQEDDEAGRRVLDYVVVTAQKREQNLQEVSVGVSSIGDKGVDTYKILDNRDIQYVTPSFSFGDSQSSRVRSSFIRGLGTVSLSDGVETSVGTFVDGVVMGRDFQAFNNFSDIERIEVLRGPQGTLFGKNTSAGLMHIITADPEFELGGNASLSYGSDNDVRVSGTVTGPLSDNVAFRLSAYSNTRDGLTRNITTGAEAHDASEQGIRGKLLFNIDEASELLLSADYVVQEADCCGAAPRFVQPGGTAERLLSTFLGLPPGSIDETNRLLVANTPYFQETTNWGVSATYKRDLGNLDLISITGYREGDFLGNTSGDQYPHTFIDFAQNDSTTDQFTQELRLESDFDGGFNFISGLYYFQQDVSTFTPVGLVNFWQPLGQPAPFDLTGAPQPELQGSSVDASVSFENYAIFGQGTFDLTDQARLVGGLRYTHDEVEAVKTVLTNNVTVPFPYNPTDPTNPFFGAPPPPNTVFLPFPDGMGGIVNAPFVPFPGPIAAPAGTVITPSVEEEDFSYRLAFEYDLTDDAMVYASYSKGYKGPALDIQPTTVLLAGQEDQAIVGPETVYNTELGLRSSWFGGSALLNVTLFHTEAEELQAGIREGITLILRNVGEVENTGVEVDFIAIPSDSLQFSGFVSYQDAEIKKFDGSEFLIGERPQRTPEWSYSFQGQHTMPVPMFDSELVSSLAYSWRSEERLSLFAGDAFIQDSYGLLDANISLNTNDGKYEFSLWGKNLTDEDYSTFITSVAGAIGAGGGEIATNHIPGRERYFGVSAKVNF